MNTERTTAGLYSALEANGLKGKIVSVSRLNELQRELESLYRQGSFLEEFYRERLVFLITGRPKACPKRNP